MKKNKKRIKYITGIDEVGRGSLAGPVVVAALALPQKSKNQFRLPKKFAGLIYKTKPNRIPLKDSKKLTPKQREAWFKYIKNHPHIFYAVTSVSPRVIDKINVSNAANLAAGNAFRRLIKNSELRIKNCAIFLDGGLYINKLQTKNYKLKTKTIIRGDEKIPVISLASIVAKVSRDRQMLRLHKKYPKYGFNKHKGYGTKKHIKAIKKHGLTPIHRKSFKIKHH